MAFDKHRFRFRKSGELRFVSHLDLMRAFERMLRRSGLPLRSTEGFHPHPRLVFAQSLSLGIGGLREVVEIEWLEPVETSASLAHLTQQAPPGLAFLDVRRIELKQTARARRGVYSLSVPPAEIAGLRDRCQAMLDSTEIWVERERPRPREINIRIYLHNLRCGLDYLEIDLWISQDGTARADEVLRALGLAHLLDAGAVIERTFLEIEDEIDPSSSIPRPVLPGRDDRAALERPLKHSPLPSTPPPPAHAAHWGASPSGPIME